MDWNTYERQLVKKLKTYPFLIWKNKKVFKTAKRMFKEGRSIDEALGVIIIESNN